MSAIVKGSLGALSQQNGASLAESFLSADAIVVVDVSGSMDTRDAEGGRQRYEVACEELRKLQERIPGKVAVVAFSGEARFAPSGLPPFIGGGTNLAGALRFVKPADGTVRFVVVSDGQPDDSAAVLKVARAFSSPIDTVYIGPPDGPGEQFLAELARASRGQHATADRGFRLAEKVQLMLGAG